MKLETLDELIKRTMLRGPAPNLIGDGLIVPGGSVVVYGPAELYKSFALQQLCGSVVTGAPWLGYPVDPAHCCGVVYAQAEITDWRMGKRAAALLQSYPSSAGVGSRFWHTRPEDLYLDLPLARTELLNVIEKSGAGLLALDPIGLMLHGSENTPEVVNAAVRTLKWVQAETERRSGKPLTIVVSHHSNKGQWFGGQRIERELVDASGHYALMRWPDTVVRLGKVPELGLVELKWEKVRHGEKPPPRWLRFNPALLVLEVAGQDPATVVLELVAEGARQIEAVDEAVAGRCGISVRRAGKVRKQLVEQGVLEEWPDPQNKSRRLVGRRKEGGT